MTYDEIIAYLFSLQRKENHRLPCDLSKELNHPERSYPIIHVAGTNGKGSVCFKIAAALAASGYRVGLYSSPHIHSFTERITINSEPISKESVVSGLQSLFSLCRKRGWEACFFTLVTFLAFETFREKEVDVAVIETGIGGRLDSTNVVAPLLSVITSIGKDHEELLGNSIESIAREKGGIIKEGVPVVIGPNAPNSLLKKMAQEKRAPIHLVEETKGFYDKENSAIAKKTLSLLDHHFSLTEEAKECALTKRPPFRFFNIGRVLFDVAHNRLGFERLFEGLSLFFQEEEISFILAVKKEKDYSAILKEMVKRAKQIHLIDMPGTMHAKASDLEECLKALKYDVFSTHQTVSEALQEALTSDQLIVICGSFSLMHPAYAFLQKRLPFHLSLDNKKLEIEKCQIP